jgi:serine/threonine protein kinase/polyhydroxyalkanoate synthesis regulator phasin
VPYTHDSSRNLLFGVFALQNGLIDQAQLVAAFQSWTRDKSRSMVDYLVDRGELSADDRAAVDFLVARHLQKHGGDVEKSLAVIHAGRSTRESLASLGDGDIEASLAQMGKELTNSAEASDATVTFGAEMSAATADGQRFRVLRPHAQGGLGAVFVALDAELHREVALKQILEKHADNPVSRQRFLLEAEVTGGLEHPGIVPVYGLGTDQDGRPYYAMRFIRGDTLKDAIEKFHSERSRCGSASGEPGRVSGDGGEPRRVNDGDGQAGRVRVRTVSNPRTRRAQSAPRIGDADTSPLALHKLLRRFVDVCNAIEYAHGRGVLHRDIKPANVVVGKHGETLVIDWGLAKPLGHGEPGAAGGERTLVPHLSGATTETLQGSTLGTPAFMSPEQAAGDVENLTPRSDIYSLGATLYFLLTGKAPFQGETAAALRAVQQGDFRPPRQLDPSIDPGLEAACLKAMAFDPNDRFPTARALADDIERWMADEPVSALRENWSSRLRRWGRKHRPAVAAATGLLITSCIALLIGTILITREWRQTQAQRNLARAQGQQARQAVHLLTKVADSGFDEQLDPLQKEFLANALAYYERFTADVADEPGVKMEHGRAYQQMGDIQRKLGLLRQSEQSYRRAIATLEPLAGRADRGREAQQALARTRTLLADLLVRRGADKGEAEALYRQALLLQQTLVSLPKATITDLLRLAQTRKSRADFLRLGGQLKKARGDYDEAVAILEKARADDPKQSEIQNELALAFDYRGWVHRELGDVERAEQDYRHALELLDPLVAQFPTVPRFRAALAKACNSLGLIEKDTGRLNDAEAHFMRELPLVERLAQDFPDRPEHRRLLARTVMNLGIVLLDEARGQAAEPYLRHAIELATAIVAKHPDDVQFRFDLAKAHTNLGELLRTSGAVKEAVDSFVKARALNETLVKELPDKPRYRQNLAGNLVDLALALEVVDPARVEETYRTALSIYEQLVAQYPDNADFRLEEALCIRNFGPFLAAAKRSQAAEALYRRGLDMLELKDGQKLTAQQMRVKAGVLNNLGELQNDLGRPEAAQSLRAALSIFVELAARSPTSIEDRHFVAVGQNNVADCLVKLGRRDEAAGYLARSVALLEKLVAEAPDEIDLHSHFGIVLEGQSDVLFETGKPLEAGRAIKRAVAEQRQALKLSQNRGGIRRLLTGHLLAQAKLELKAGDFQEAAAAALDLPKTAPPSGRAEACCDAATILAQAIAQIEANVKLPESERKQLARTYLGRTVVLLGEAIDGNPKLGEKIKNDAYIKALRARPEVQTVLSALESVQR